MLRLSDIFGQGSAVDWLGRALAAERLPHGLIFAGPAGVGKASTARALAGVFLCEKPVGTEPCGACDGCRMMGRFNEIDQTTAHPDYHVIRRQLIRLTNRDAKARDLSIDVVRDHLIAPANMKPILGRGKFFAVEEAELMSTAAQNALLKTLEEPLGRTIIVLLTDQPDALLPTIRSRAQAVRFAPLEAALVQRELAQRGLDQQEARAAAELADGSLGVALTWHRQGIVSRARDLEPLIARLMQGARLEGLPATLRAAADAYAKEQLAIDEKASQDMAMREGVAVYLRIISGMLRRTLADTAETDLLEAICTAVEAIRRAEDLLDSNVNVSLVLQQLAATLNAAFGELSGVAGAK